MDISENSSNQDDKYISQIVANNHLENANDLGIYFNDIGKNINYYKNAFGMDERFEIF